MKMSVRTFAAAAALAALSVNSTVTAAAPGGTGMADPLAVACFKETQRALAAAADLNPSVCTQALDSAPHTARHKAAMYFNRALIERASSQPAAAVNSLEAALGLDSELVEAIIARAQLAVSQGDFARAEVLVDELLRSHAEHALVKRYRDQFETQLRRVRSEQGEVASVATS